MSTESKLVSPIDDHIFLSGRPPLGEYLGFIAGQAGGETQVDLAAIAAEWRQANDYVRELERTEAGLADGQVTEPIPDQLAEIAGQVLSDPILHRSFSIVPSELGIIDLEQVVVYQKHINLSFVERLKMIIGPSPTAAEIMKFCLPYDHPAQPVRELRVANNVYIFISPSNDFRFLESAFLQPAQVLDYVAPGVPTRFVGIAVGYGSNYLNVIHAEGRIVLHNGSHRAYALRDLGINKVPALIQHVSRRDELPVISGPEVYEHADLYFTSPRPPMLRDYFDPRLRKIIPVPRRHRQVKISFGVEQIDVPAS